MVAGGCNLEIEERASQVWAELSLGLLSVIILTWACPGSHPARPGQMTGWSGDRECHSHNQPSDHLRTDCEPMVPPPPHTNHSFLLQLNIHCGFIGVVSPAQRQQLGNPARSSPLLWVCPSTSSTTISILRYPLPTEYINSADFERFFAYWLTAYKIWAANHADKRVFHLWHLDREVVHWLILKWLLVQFSN